MKHFQEVVLSNLTGLPVNGASVTVRVAAVPIGTGALASLFSDNGVTATTNPVTTDALGRFGFYVADGRYDITFTSPFITTFTLNDAEIDEVAGSGITSVASLAATCTPGVTAPVQLNVSPYGIYNCTATNVWTRNSGDTGAINAKNYGVKADGQVCFGTNVTWTNTSTTVSCSTATFTATDVGKTIFGTNGCCGVGAQIGSVVQLPQGTISSVTNGTTVVVSLAATATSGSNAALVWGTLDDTAWDAAEAAWASATNDSCQALEWPAGYSLIARAHWNPTQGPCLGASQSWQTGGNSLTYQIQGQGPGVSVAVPVPNFDFATCTFGSGANGCFFSYTEATIRDLGIWGGANSLTGTTHANRMINWGIGAQGINVSFAGFGASSTSLVGITLNWTRATLLVCDGFGRTCGSANNGTSTLLYSFFGDTAGPNLELTSSAVTVDDFGGQYGLSTGTVIINQAGTFNCYGCSLFSGPATNGTGILMSNFANAKTRLIGGRWNNTATTSNGVFMNDASQLLYASGNSIIGGTTAAINRTLGTVHLAPDTILIGTTGTSLLPTCTFTTGGGTTPDCFLQTGSTNEKGTIIATTGTGTPGTTGTITLTFAGTYSGAVGATPSCTYTLNDSAIDWGNGALVRVSTQSTTAPVLAWSNSVNNVLTALPVSSSFRIDYVCVAR